MCTSQELTSDHEEECAGLIHPDVCTHASENCNGSLFGSANIITLDFSNLPKLGKGAQYIIPGHRGFSFCAPEMPVFLPSVLSYKVANDSFRALNGAFKWFFWEWT